MFQIIHFFFTFLTPRDGVLLGMPCLWPPTLPVQPAVAATVWTVTTPAPLWLEKTHLHRSRSRRHQPRSSKLPTGRDKMCFNWTATITHNLGAVHGLFSFFFFRDGDCHLLPASPSEREIAVPVCICVFYRISIHFELDSIDRLCIEKKTFLIEMLFLFITGSQLHPILVGWLCQVWATLCLDSI